MQEIKTRNPYLENLLHQIFDSNQVNVLDSKQNTSWILTGFDHKDVVLILDIIKSKYPTIDSYIISENLFEDTDYISISELKTLNKKQKTCVYILPSDKSEDLQDLEHLQLNEISHKELQQQLLDELITRIPEEFTQLILEDIIGCLKYLKDEPLQDTTIINYLTALETQGYTAIHIGNYLYLLDLIPDADLLLDTTKTRTRIHSNLISVNVLVKHEKTLYDRILKLPVHKNSIQRHIVDFFRNEANIKTASDLVKTIFEHYEMLNFSNWKIIEENLNPIALPSEHVTPEYDLLIGNSSSTPQFGLIGESISGRKVAIDLSGTNTISLFGVQGGGKSYTIGTITEMVIKQFSHVCELPSPLAGVIFHYSESMDYEPEFTSMIYPNDKEKEIEKLKRRYGADPSSLEDVIILCPKDKVKEKQLEYPSVQVNPISFSPSELNVQDWMFMLGALGNDANYVRQLKAIAKKHRKNINLDVIEEGVLSSSLFTEFERGLALQKLDFAREYIDDSSKLKDLLRPGRLIIVDLRDEFIDKDEALGLFVIILNIFSGVKIVDGKRFNKFIVFDEAHKYMDNKDLTSNIVTTIREMRHKGVNIMIASQDPPSLPKEIIELSSVVLLHKFNSPHWLAHIKNALAQLEILSPQDMNVLTPGEGYLWATKATEKGITHKPLKITARPRVTKHGGATLQATDKK
ncbi:hypothetical protein SAMN05421766_1195 [Zobellia uliginosa]|uniref:ATP-binding protein n=1 Tax=Zobellia uliginosa TaxID=143224 RepID=A0ABY1L5P2_9FLAO|nr:ATP-binding protein [Zobellia uliginosa]SIT16588.1 hypothetical protein SAMN05421766_1195 [Zobellia uliginosa]